MRQKLHKLNDIFSWVLLIATSVMLVLTVYSVMTTPKGEGTFLFGYRPVFVLTGSMEPYMLTNSICVTEKVDDLDDIAVGDVVTFHIEGKSGKNLNITHRIIGIDENGIISTKGDNNRVTDNLPLTIDNIDAKVICVFNQSAWLIDKWETTTGKVMIISFGLALICGYYTLKMFFNSYIEEKKKAKTDSSVESESCESDEINHLDSGSDYTESAPDQEK